MAAQGLSNDRNDDLPAGYVFQVTDESLIKSLIKLNEAERFSTDGRFVPIDLFARHPALVINEKNIYPGRRDNRNYYYFYCEVPDGTGYDLKGYHRINDREDMGFWQKTEDSFIFPCDIPERGQVFGEKQTFRYTPVDRIKTTWRMHLYGLPHHKIDIDDDVGGSEKTKRPKKSQSNMVICEVFETADSETAEAVRSAAEAKRNFDEILNLKVSQAAKVEQMEAALQVEQAKYDRYLATTEACRGVLAERLIDRADAEQKEANDIIARRGNRTFGAGLHGNDHGIH